MFNIRKAVQMVVYILSKLNSKSAGGTKLNKLCFLADRESIQQYYLPISKAIYIADDRGPVPIEIFHMLKKLKNSKNITYLSQHVDCKINKGQVCYYLKDNVCSINEKTFDKLCLSDLECLDKVIELYGKLSGNELSKKLHNPEFCPEYYLARHGNSPSCKEMNIEHFLIPLKLTEEEVLERIEIYDELIGCY